MDKNFIDQVHDIVISNMTDEKFGAQKLASKLNLSTSQTLRKVKAATGKSVNQYIRELRLKKAAKLIKKTDFTIAEIAYKVGFGNHSYFTTTFLKFYGISPGKYKSSIISLDELAKENTKRRIRANAFKRKVVSFMAIALLFVVGYLIINNTTSKNIPRPNSIAVLPFRDMSPEDAQWFGDGVADNILTYLSQINDLTVISFTSSSTFRETDKTIPQIAKELGVSYILEGSLTVYEDKIKINTQLINANDEHLWSEEYTFNFEDVIAMQQNVSKEIARELKITLSPDEALALEKYPTENMEAYHLYLKGRLPNESRKVEVLKLNIELNKQAIALDSTFSDAYAEIANSYFLLSHYHAYTIDPFDARDKATYYINKALQIDYNNIKALGVKSSLLNYKDWDKSKEYIEKAITLNTNDALSQTRYAVYFILNPNPDIKKFLEHAKIAQRLNPLSRNLALNYFNALMMNKKFNEAEEHLNKMGFLLSGFQYIEKESELIAHKNKDWTTVIPFLKTKIEKDSNNAILYYLLGSMSDGVLNDKKSAIYYAKKAYEIDSANSGIAELYVYQLIEGNKFDDAKRIMETENFKSICSERTQLRFLWSFYYTQGNSKKALEISKDSLFTNDYNIQSLTYAQLGDRKKVDSINKKQPWGTGRGSDWHARRAILHEVLKDSDSMYFYLENIKFDYYVRFINGRSQFDPYRNEERYKAFLRKWYFPVPSE